MNNTRSSHFFIAVICSIGLGPANSVATAQQQNSNAVTFTKDVAPILQRSCQGCHRPGSMAPMSLVTYEDARPWARAIKAKVLAREMPPWFIDKTIGIQEFKDDLSLSDKEIQTLAKWADGGAMRGNAADLPSPIQFPSADAWSFGEPDLIVYGVRHTVPANDADWWGNYTVDTGLTEDRYIRAVDTKPGPGALSKQVAHHIISNIIQAPTDKPLPGVEFDRDGEGSFLHEYAAGKQGDLFPEGSGRLIRAGAKLRMNMHYHSVGVEVEDQPRVGLYFYPKGYVPKYHIISQSSGRNEDVDVPAGVDNVRHDGYTIVPRPMILTAFQPHMHNRGKAQCITAIYPYAATRDTKVETLSCVNNFNFTWHRNYHFADHVAPLLPAGTVLQITSWHDNTIKNRYNPDPENWVGQGERTIDDMSHAWLTYIFLSDKDFAERVREREARKAGSRTQNQNE